MTFSDALPIQFWVNGEETFNEKAVCGIIKQDCFCQPVECDDEITIQFQDEPGKDFSVNVGNSSSDPFSLENNHFDTNIDGWSNVGSGTDWLGGVTITYTNIAIGESSKRLEQVFPTLPAGMYRCNINVYNAGGGATTMNWKVEVYNGATLVQELLNFNQSLTTLEDTGIIEITGSFDRIAFSTSYVSGVDPFQAGVDYINLYNSSSDVSLPMSENDGVYTVNFILGEQGVVCGEKFIIEIYDTSTSPQVLVAKSDCIDVKESHECTKLIGYSNASDFDGIVYTDASPPPTFYLRIPATFFEEDNPQEQEDLELSNGVIVTLRQSIQEKTLLETGYMPNYMHKKLQKVLMHETIEIDGDNWKRRDPYETNPIKKYNLKRGSVLLTKYNSVLKNTI